MNKINFGIERALKIAYYAGKFDGQGNDYPFSLQCAIVDKCFNDCIMCNHPQREHMFSLDPDLWCEFIEKAKKGGTETVCYSGGDPFAYHHLNQVMQKHIDINLGFGILCAGYVPKNANLDLIKHAEWVRISLDTIVPEEYSIIRGLIHVNKVLESIERLLAHGITVEISATAHNHNAQSLPLMFQWASDRNIPVWVKTAYEGTIPIDKVDWEMLRSWEDKLPILRIHDGKTYNEFDSCVSAVYQTFIDAQGDVYPCCTLAGDYDDKVYTPPFGNIKDDWKPIWRKMNEFSCKTYSDLPKQCSVCQGRFTEINSTVELINRNQRAFF